MSTKVVVDPEQLAKVAANIVAVADQVHGAVSTADESPVGDSAAGGPGANGGFVTAALAATLWSRWRSTLLDDATKVAQFGDDLASGGGAWRRVDAVSNRSFTQPGG